MARLDSHSVDSDIQYLSTQLELSTIESSPLLLSFISSFRMRGILPVPEYMSGRCGRRIQPSPHQKGRDC